jgi:inward rectifier potassium channel
MFRIANRRPNVLMEIEATLLLMTVEDQNGEKRRRYQGLTLEREKVYFLPLTWTVVHAIDQSSPLHGMTAADLERLQAEFLILIKAFDDTFSQVVHSRCSYTFDEIAWGAKFLPAFETTGDGDLLLHVDKLSLRE